MIHHYPLATTRLTVSALFSVAIHALILVLMAGLVFFPEVYSKALTPLEVTLEPAPTAMPTQAVANVQWTAQPSFSKAMAGKKVRTVSASNHQPRDADYLARWRARVEQFGTQVYQQRIKQAPVSGEVRILVSIGLQGELLGAQIRQSSGQPALDKMALDILRQMAPFEPLPAEIRTDTEVLEIIRTWKFTTKEGLRAG
jgi:TonB family protein